MQFKALQKLVSGLLSWDYFITEQVYSCVEEQSPELGWAADVSKNAVNYKSSVLLPPIDRTLDSWFHLTEFELPKTKV